MSTSGLLFFGFLAYMGLFGMGNALQCYSYQCANYSAIVPNKPCPQPKAVTCGLSIVGTPADRCVTIRTKVKMEMGGQVVVMHQETRNCTSSLQCNPELVCKLANQSSGGKIEKCELGCCQGDLCNTGGPIPTPGPKPTGPSGSDLSCYMCGSGTMNVSNPMLPTNDCKNPVKATCGIGKNGMLQDRCMRAKLKSGDKEYEVRNCSGPIFCNKVAICKMLNQQLGLTSCDISCCYGNLCNAGTTAAPMTTAAASSGPIVTTPSSSATIISGTMACFLVVLSSLVVLMAEMK